MFESRNWLVQPAVAAALAIIALGGCSASKDGDPYPPPAQSESMTAYFSTTGGRLPYPIDLFFAPSAAAPAPDGTLNLPATIPWRGAAVREALNSQDGWGTSSTLTATFSMPLDPATISGSTVKIVKVWLNPSTKGPANPADPTQAALYLPAGATSPVAAPPLVFGTDYTADVAPDIDSEGKTLRITPLKPFDYSRGPTANAGTPNANKVLNVGYIVILTNGLTSDTGVAAQSDTEYDSYKTAADCAAFTGTPALLCQLVKAHIGIGAAVTQTNPADIVLTWGFSTQSMDDTMKVLALSAPANQTLIVPTGNKTPGGKANVFVGSTMLPYYMKPAASPTDRSPLTSVWKSATGPNPAFGLDPDSRNVTMFNPMPAKQADVTVPVIVSIPDPTTSACLGKPAAGWPVAIVMHGLGRNRSDAMAIADALADKCIAVAAIDHLLHGITDTANPLYCTPAKPQCIGASERTFDLDLINNSTGASVPDGVIDPSATHAINLASPATTRDQLRQGAADIMAFAKSLPSMAIPPGTPLPAGPVGVDPARIHYIGDSLGAIAGATTLSYVPTVRSATLEAPGGVITSILFESPSFKDRIYSGLTNAGLAPDTFAFNLFRRDFQSIVDSGDPVNYIAATQARVPTHLIKWPNDTVVPNESTDNLIRAADLERLTDLGPNPVQAGSGAYVLFSAGAHGSIFSPAASGAATVEAQTQSVLFADSVNEAGGPFVVLTNPAVLDLD